MKRMGYREAARQMFLENIFLPLPSDLIMPLVGFTAIAGYTQR